MASFRRAARHRPVAQHSQQELARRAAELARVQAHVQARAYLLHLR